VSSDTGTNATLQPASTHRAGVMSKAKFDEVELNNAKFSNVTTDLSEGDVTFSTVDVNSSDGKNATLFAATSLRAGVMSKEKFNEVELNNVKVTNVTTHLSIANKTDTTDATVPQVTITEAGLMSASDKIKLDGITPGAKPKPELTKSMYLFDPIASEDIIK
jgi:hypothetical protein